MDFEHRHYVYLALAFAVGITTACKTFRLSTSETQDIATNVDEYGNASGTVGYFYIDFTGGAASVMRGRCPKDVKPNRYSCAPYTKVSLFDLLETYGSGLDAAMFRILVTLRTQAQSDAALVAFQQQMRGSNSDIQNQINSLVALNDRSNATPILKNFLDENRGILKVIGKMGDEDFVFDETAASFKGDAAEFKALRRLNENFNKARVKYGVPCERETQGLKSSDGGCLDTSKNLVWGGTQYVGSRFNNGFWLYREAAAFRCATLGAGGYTDWRLPSREELLTVGSQKALDIGFDPQRYYWTHSEEDKTIIDRFNRRVGDRVVSSTRRPVYVGSDTWSARIMFSHDIGTSSTPVFSEEINSLIEINRILRAQFTYQKNIKNLVNPARRESSEVTRHSLVSAAGQINADLIRRIDRPGTVINQPYEAFGGREWGSTVRVVTRDIQDSPAGTARYDVDPFEYINYQLPADFSPDQISLACVRNTAP